MAELDGQITKLAIGGKDPTSNISSDLDGYDFVNVWNSPNAQMAEFAYTQERVFNTADAHVRALSGSMNRHYVDDFYNRVHVFPSYKNVGQLLTVQTFELEAWNGFLSESKDLDGVSKENATGISIDDEDSYPVTFAPMEARNYTVTVDVAGPPSIDADIKFEWAVYTVTARIVGSRLVLWRWMPRGSYTEKLEWKTEVLKTRKGEQRIAYRDAPRQIFNLDFLRPPEEIAEIKVVVDAWNFRQFGLPIFKEATTGIDASEGDKSIDFDTSYKDFQEDELACLWEGPEKAEAVKITNVRSDGIDIDQGLENDFTDAFVMPVKEAIVPDGFEFDRGSRGKHTRFSASFLIVDTEDLSETGEYDTYRDRDVLTDGNIIIGDMSERIHRPLTQIDNGQGPITIETKQDWTQFARTMGKFTKTLSALWQWRKWLHSRKGKQKTFWMPSWNEDLVLAEEDETISDSDTEIRVENRSLSIYADLPLDFMLELKDGTVFYRRIESVTELTDGDEQITIDSDFGQEITKDDIDLWCFMDLVRFNADSIELEHQNPYIMRTSVPVIRVPE